jgi:enoyl-CoA hydratase/carnithine racemase
MSDPVRVTDRDQVRWIELDRPGSRNALTVEVNQALIAAVSGAAGAGARAVVLTGANGNFCSGLDLKEAMRAGPQNPETTAENMRLYFHGLIRAVAALEIPSVAAVDGAAVGFGCDLALVCDVRVLSDRASFAELFVRRGLMPDGGSSWTLPRLVGVGRALDLMLSGERIAADEAFRIGLGSRMWPAAELTERTWELARRLAAGPPLAYKLLKRAVYDGQIGDLSAALDRELAGQLQCLRSNDFMEGVMAFLQKREPRFTGS